MAENIIVGAGLSGLVAAINLAREGREVLVLERESRVGGFPLYHPSPQGTPLIARALERYIGIDISPVLYDFEGKSVVYGKVFETDTSAISAKLLERGPRSGSLDTYLFEIAKKEGVRFEFGKAFYSWDDFSELPPDTIIATGLHFEGFDSMRVPYLTSFHYLARKTVNEARKPHVTIYHEEFTSDYAYTTSLSGIVLAHLFQRTPIGRKELALFEEAIFKNEGLEFENWTHFTFPVPAASIKNPRLFSGDKILAGTLAGLMEPFMFFGIHGALISGKIAAIAVSDKARALEEFKKATSSFRGAYIFRKVSNAMPHFLKKLILPAALGRGLRDQRVTKIALRSVPGWRNCESE